MIGSNHRDDCTGVDWHYSGRGYNRVRICSCGAEDHAPEFSVDYNEVEARMLVKGGQGRDADEVYVASYVVTVCILAALALTLWLCA